MTDSLTLGVVQCPLGDDVATNVARVEAHGATFGDYPLSGYFWSKVDEIGTPIRFVCSMCLTFENANLDHALDLAAAARAADHGPTDRLLGLRDDMQAIVSGQPTTFAAFWEADGAFHRAVAESARLHLLPDILDDQRRTAHRCSLTRTYDSFVDQAREHVAIAQAIIDRDPETAAHRTTAHFDNVRARFLGTFATS